MTSFIKQTNFQYVLMTLIKFRDFDTKRLNLVQRVYSGKKLIHRAAIYLHY